MKLRRFVVAEDSMRPTLAAGDRIVGARDRPIRRRDLVVFEHPRRPDFWMVKRVVALEGEHLDLDAGTLDGAPLDDPLRDELTESGSFDVPAGHLFVMSDDRTRSTVDSRVVGPVVSARSYVVVFRYRPLARFGPL